MPGNWNPNHPGAIGLEWLPTRRYTGSVAPGSTAFAMQLRSTQAEAITGFRMNATGASTIAPLFTLVDVYPAASLVTSAGARKNAYLPPNADQDRGTWVSPGGLTTNLWSYINDLPIYPPTETVRYIRQSTSGTSAYRCWVDDSAVPAGARICQMQVRAVIGAHPNPTVTTRGFVFRLQHVPSGDLYTPPNSSFAAHIYGQLVAVTFGEVNPRTLLPWTRADLAEFNGGDWVLRVEAIGDTNTWAKVEALALLVDYLDTENRVASATWNRPAGAPSDWVATDALVSLPSGATGWSKPASGDFVYVWRPANAPMVTGSSPKATDVRWEGGLQDLGPAGVALPPVPGMSASAATVDAYGLVTSAAGFGEVAMGLVLVKSGPAYSDDSQPYDVSGTAEMVAASGNVVAQRVRQVSGSTQNYLGLRFVVVPPATGSSTLTVTVHLVSSGAQVGGSFTVTAPDVRALPEAGSPGSGWRLVEGFLSSAAALANNTQYEVRFTASGGSWGFAAPDAGTFASASYRGTTDSARSGGLTLTASDLAAVLLIQPTAPGSVEARTIEWEPWASTKCGPGAMDQVVVSWEATTLSTAFARYEVERLGQDGEWYLVATPLTEATASWLDLEAPRNRPSKYRVRVVANTAAFSDWMETEFVTPEQDGPEVVFTSNARPDLTVVLHHEPNVPFTFPDHDTDESYLPYGGEGRVVFFDPVDRGVTKRYRLVVNFADVPHDDSGHRTGDDAIWEPLRRLTRATDVPYVAVLDSYGNVSYAHVTLDNGDRDQPGDRYQVDATVTPVQFHPAAVT